jgi:hypothetical protein
MGLAQGFFLALSGQESEKHMESRTELVVLEAKYCEGCGALCLRPAGTKMTYCQRCTRRMEEMASAKREQGGRP